MNIQTLIFVYNADANVFAMLTDFAHKILSPSSYGCNLCKVTYGHATMKRQWLNFIESLPVQVDFLHRDELREQYPQFASTALPAIFAQQADGTMSVAVNKEDIDKATSVDDMEHLVKRILV